MLGVQALVTGVKAIAEDMGGGEASLGGTGGGGAVGCSGTPSGEGAEPTQPSSGQCQSFCLKGTGSCAGCVNRSRRVRRPQGWRWKCEAGTEPV